MSKSIIHRLAAIEAKADEHLFGFKRDPVTGAFVNDEGKSAGAGDVVKSAAKVGITAGAIGAGAVGAKAAHSAIMGGFGGEAGGAGQAYKNAARNVVRDAGVAMKGVPGQARSAIQTAKSAVAGAVDRGAAAYGNAQKMRGLGGAAAAGRGLKKALNPALAKLRKLTGFDARQRLTELAAKLP